MTPHALRLRAVTVGVLSAMAALAHAQTFPTSYTVTELKYPTGVSVAATPNFQVVALNNKGQVLGNAYGEVKTGKMVTQQVKILGGLLTVPMKVAESYLVNFPVLWNSGTPSVLPWVTKGTDAVGLSLNDAGDVAGQSFGLSLSMTTPTTRQAYYDSSVATIWRAGVPSTLASGPYSAAFAINNTGTVITAGFGSTTHIKGSTAVAQLWLQGQPTPMADHKPADFAVDDRSLTDLNTVYGTGPAHTYEAPQFQLVDLGTRALSDVQVPGKTWTRVVEMDQSGMLAGVTRSSDTHEDIFTRDAKGIYQVLTTPSNDWANTWLDPRSVNKLGQVAGCYTVSLPKFDATGQATTTTTAQVPHCGVWTRSGFNDLTGKASLPSGEVILEALKINDAGQVLVKVGTFTVKPDPANYVVSDFPTIVPKRYAVLTPR